MSVKSKFGREVRTIPGHPAGSVGPPLAAIELICC